MFQFTRKPSSGSHSQYLAKITHSVQCVYMEAVQTWSVLWLHSMTCEACVLVTHGVTMRFITSLLPWKCFQ
jgi:hypothetical protein